MTNSFRLCHRKLLSDIGKKCIFTHLYQKYCSLRWYFDIFTYQTAQRKYILDNFFIFVNLNSR